MLSHSVILFYSECFKTAKIIPIFKSGDSNSTVNYRPISMLPSISKIFGKLNCARLDFYMKMYNILFTNKFGFLIRYSFGLKRSFTLHYASDVIVSSLLISMSSCAECFREIYRYTAMTLAYSQTMNKRRKSIIKKFNYCIRFVWILC